MCQRPFKEVETGCMEPGKVLWFKQLQYQSVHTERSFREAHVSQQRSSCFRLFLNFCVSLRSCRLFTTVTPFFFCLYFTGEGTGGLIPVSFLIGCSWTLGRPWVNLWTCAGTTDRNHKTSTPTIYTQKDRDKLTIKTLDVNSCGHTTF